MRVVGWGSTSNTKYKITLSPVPQKLDIPVQTPDLCENLGEIQLNKDIQLCAGGEPGKFIAGVYLHNFLVQKI